MVEEKIILYCIVSYPAVGQMRVNTNGSFKYAENTKHGGTT